MISTINRSGVIRACQYAIAAADAFVGIDVDNTIRSLKGRSGRADFQTRRIVAMHAPPGHGEPLPLRGRRFGQHTQLSPQTFRNVVGMTAGGHTGLAADTTG